MTTAGQLSQRRNRISATGGFWDHAIWLERLCLAAPALLFLRIGWKYLSDPEGAAAASQIVLGSPAAATDMRAFGAIFLAFAAIALVSLVSTRHLLTGLTVVVAVVACATAARVLGMVADGATSETRFKLIAEVVLLAVSMAGGALELRRRHHVRKRAI
jgi:Domain of unknown function (DUF4345)